MSRVEMGCNLKIWASLFTYVLLKCLRARLLENYDGLFGFPVILVIGPAKVIDKSQFYYFSPQVSIPFFLTDSKCDKKAKKLQSQYLTNPMAEYMHFNHDKDHELDKTYKDYKMKHAKNYSSPAEHEQRKHIFKHNLR